MRQTGTPAARTLGALLLAALCANSLLSGCSWAQPKKPPATTSSPSPAAVGGRIPSVGPLTPAIAAAQVQVTGSAPADLGEAVAVSAYQYATGFLSAAITWSDFYATSGSDPGPGSFSFFRDLFDEEGRASLDEMTSSPEAVRRSRSSLVEYGPFLWVSPSKESRFKRWGSPAVAGIKFYPGTADTGPEAGGRKTVVVTIPALATLTYQDLDGNWMTFRILKQVPLTLVVTGDKVNPFLIRSWEPSQMTQEAPKPV